MGPNSAGLAAGELPGGAVAAAALDAFRERSGVRAGAAAAPVRARGGAGVGSVPPRRADGGGLGVLVDGRRVWCRWSAAGSGVRTRGGADVCLVPPSIWQDGTCLLASGGFEQSFVAQMAYFKSTLCGLLSDSSWPTTDALPLQGISTSATHLPWVPSGHGFIGTQTGESVSPSRTMLRLRRPPAWSTNPICLLGVRVPLRGFSKRCPSRPHDAKDVGRTHGTSTALRRL